MEHSKIVGFDSIMEIPGVIAVIPLKEEGDEVIMPPEHFSSCFIANIILEGKALKILKTSSEKSNHL